MNCCTRRVCTAEELRQRELIVDFVKSFFCHGVRRKTCGHRSRRFDVNHHSLVCKTDQEPGTQGTSRHQYISSLAQGGKAIKYSPQNLSCRDQTSRYCISGLRQVTAVVLFPSEFGFVHHAPEAMCSLPYIFFLRSVPLIAAGHICFCGSARLESIGSVSPYIGEK